ncbi:TPA: hypothetical protein N0F65_008469 [Lagenidium giganteum]|uniref:Uncharacterized protein n=1 Tax=Lagenidium giganteum TaxID=4803 RepID=A0AAV2Z3H4_9STRA|nr:TPA: hypothetical protein N0F65_008469 [Lagenidium giganteum]
MNASATQEQPSATSGNDGRPRSLDNAPTKPRLTLQQGLHEAALATSASSATAAAAAGKDGQVPVTPSAATATHVTTTGATSPAAVFSPRDPAAKVAAQSPAIAKLVTDSCYGLDKGVASPPLTCGTPSNQVVSGLTQTHPTIQPPAFSSSSMGTPHFASSKRGAATSSTTSSAVTSKASSPKPTKGNTGRWTEAEHKLFLKGLESFPYRAWKKIATLIKTRTVVQIRTHAQKYYQKLEKEEARMREREQQLNEQQQGAASTRTAEVSNASLSSDPSSGEQSDKSVSAKKKHMMRKRKSSIMEEPVVTSLPKRMAREKKAARTERHMSPKQKMSSASSAKLVMPSSYAPVAFSEPPAARPLSASRPAGLDFDDAGHSATMSSMLEFPDEKPMTEFPFSIEGGLDQCIAFDNDDLLQLTDEESLDWFSSSGGEQDDMFSAASPTGSSCADET